MATPDHQARLAVLIDADNVPPQCAADLFQEIAKYGTASVRRAYGNWTTTQLTPWKDAVLEHAIQPVQQFANTSGKGSTDASLIIDAMDLLHAGNLDGFCVVSSDSDYTRLASRIREQGLVVYGFGEEKTPAPLVTACNVFVYLENLGNGSALSKREAKRDVETDSNLARWLSTAVDAASREGDWAHLGEVGSRLSRLHSSFDTRTWGFSKLRDLMEQHPDYEVKQVSTDLGRPAVVYVRRKPKAKKRQSR